MLCLRRLLSTFVIFLRIAKAEIISKLNEKVRSFECHLTQKFSEFQNIKLEAYERNLKRLETVADKHEAFLKYIDAEYHEKDGKSFQTTMQLVSKHLLGELSVLSNDTIIRQDELQIFQKLKNVVSAFDFRIVMPDLRKLGTKFCLGAAASGPVNTRTGRKANQTRSTKKHNRSSHTKVDSR